MASSQVFDYHELVKLCQKVFTTLKDFFLISDIGFEIPDKFVVGYALVSVTCYQLINLHVQL